MTDIFQIRSRSLRWPGALFFVVMLSFSVEAHVNEGHARCGTPPSPVPVIPYGEEADDLPAYEYGFLLVPENRQQAQTRCILVRYIRFPAQQPSSAEPVVLLPGGPGSLINVASLRHGPSSIRTIRHVTRSRDFIVMQQRGVADGAHAAGVEIPLPGLAIDKPADTEAQAARYRGAVRDGLRSWQARGVDLRGYHIHEMVADVVALADNLGHQKIVLYGTSFGSQWSFAFIKTHPERVARAVLTGIEPLDYAWDSPDWIWDAYQRIGEHARRDPAIARALGDRELLDIFRDQITRLEKAPRKVAIVDKEIDKSIEVVITADDLRRAFPYPTSGDSLRSSLQAVPKFLLELDAGDYRYLATHALSDRKEKTEDLLWMLVDNTLGITAQREARLRSEAAARWWGDINFGYTYTRDLMPGKDVGDQFRADFDLDIPVLMLQGDVDLSTPLENALSQIPRVKRGRILVVEGGTHSVAAELLNPELIPAGSDAAERFLEFLAPSSANSAPAEAILQDLPERIALKPFEFVKPDSESLYDAWLKN